MSRVWGETAFAQRGLRQQMEGRCPDKFNKCFRIVKTQKISRGCAAHVTGSPVAPNEVPAPVCEAALTEKPVSRSVGS